MTNRHKFFWKHVAMRRKCWLWTGGMDPDGYGSFWDGSKAVGSHRYAWAMVHGEIPEGLDLDHLCRVRHCVNPDHLEPVTRKENLARGVNANREKVLCPRGHEYTPENTYMRPSGARECRLCRATKPHRRAA
jgi:hypothetical protein